MTQTLKIDFVSDVSCPWCAIGLASLQTAVQRLGPALQVDLHFQPFELNPQMVPEGEDIEEHLGRKYGSTPAQGAAVRENIRQRGAELGFVFDFNARSRSWNTFDAHRLLHWAAEEGPGLQLALKQALLVANFTDGRDIADHAVLAQVAAGVGLDAARAAEVLASGRYADEVRQLEEFFRQLGISSVPAVIIERKHLVSGGQPPEVFEQALRQIAAQPAGQD